MFNFIPPLMLPQGDGVAVLPLGLARPRSTDTCGNPAMADGVLLPVLPLFVLLVFTRRPAMSGLGGVQAR